MQFKVPHYIEVEDKIFGPLTFKQFIYVGGAAGVSFVLYKILPSFIAIPLIAGVGVLAYSLGFTPRTKYGKPFIEILEAGFKYMIKGRLYTWKKTPKKAESRAGEGDAEDVDSLLSIPKVGKGGGLAQKTLSLDIGAEEENEERTNDSRADRKFEI